MSQKISKSAINALPVGGIIADTNPIGFVARRLKSGTITYGYRFMDRATGRQRWIGLGLHGDLSPEQARRKALKVAVEVRGRRQAGICRRDCHEATAVFRLYGRSVARRFSQTLCAPELTRCRRSRALFSRRRPAKDRQEACPRSAPQGYRGAARRDRGPRSTRASRSRPGACPKGAQLARCPRRSIQLARRQEHGENEAEGARAQAGARRSGNSGPVRRARRAAWHDGGAEMLCPLRPLPAAIGAAFAHGQQHDLGRDRRRRLDRPRASPQGQRQRRLRAAADRRIARADQAEG